MSEISLKRWTSFLLVALSFVLIFIGKKTTFLFLPLSQIANRLVYLLLFLFFCFCDRLEYFSVMFNILLVLIYLFNDGLRLICWHISSKDDFTFRVCVTIKLLLWSFVFLNLLPFNFLIPTLFGRKFFLWLNSFFLLWYGTGVWNSVGFDFNAFIECCCCCFYAHENSNLHFPLLSPSSNICIIKFITPTIFRMIALAETRYQGMAMT